MMGGAPMNKAFSCLLLYSTYSYKHFHFDVHATDELIYAKAEDTITLVIVLPKEPNVSLRHQRDAWD